MMKKLIALFLALALSLSCAAVLAEATTEKIELGKVEMNGAFVLKGTIPEGYTYQINELNPGVKLDANLVKEGDPDAPYMNIMIYLEDSYEPGTKLNDVSEEVLKEIEDSFKIDAEVKIDYLDTVNGTKLMKVTEVGDDPDWIAIYTIFEGYEIEMTIKFAEDAKNPVLTDDQVEKAVKFLEDMDFVKAEEVK